MLKNWLTVAVRSLLRSPGFTVINVVGLAVGLTSCLLILLHVKDELSYDRWITDADSIYRVHTTYKASGRSDFRTVRSAGRMKDAFLAAYPGTVSEGTRMGSFTATAVVEGQPFSQQVKFVDPNFLEFFDLPLIVGDRASALADPSGLLVAPETARRLFGTVEGALGRTVTLCCVVNQRVEYRITGILEPLPDTTHFDLEMVAPFVPEQWAAAPNILDTWTSVNVYTYLKLAPGASIGLLRGDNPSFIDRHIPARESVNAPSEGISQEFINIRDIRLHTAAQAGDMGDLKPSGDMALVTGLMLVAGLILALGCITFVNMAIARSTLRAREVAVRKVLGAGRTTIMAQFLGEAVLLAMVSAVLALVLAELFLPAFNAVLGKSLSLSMGDPGFWLIVAGLLLVVGVLGGLYPALHVARFRPAPILKGEADRELGGIGGLRTALIVVQFAIAIGLSTVTAVVYHQTLFASQAALGFQRDGIIAVRALGNAVPATQRNALVEEIRRLPEVKGAALSSDVPTDNRENNTDFRRADRPDDRQGINYLSFKAGWFELYDIRPIAGRTFSEDYPTDTLRTPAEGEPPPPAAIVLNRSAVKLLGYTNPAEAVGSTLLTTLDSGERELTVIGVIEDVRFRSLRHDVQPTVMFSGPGFFNTLSVRTDANDPAALMKRLEDIWRTHVPDLPFRAQWLDAMIAGQYAGDRAQGIIFAAFAGLAILVACLGLYGLSAFAAERRTKEIGLRKVFGASVLQLVRLLVWQFSKPVVAANLLAWPVAWWFLSGWLEGFERRIELTPVYFLAAALLALAVAWATVAGHAARVAARNPVHALRYQ